MIVGDQINLNDLGASSNAYYVGGLGAVSTVSNGAITLGYYASYNTMIVTNVNLLSGAVLHSVGHLAATNNTVAVNAGGRGTCWATRSQLGNGAAAISNAFNVIGGTITNAGLINVGGAAKGLTR